MSLPTGDDLKGGRDIGFLEVLAFMEQRLASDFSERAGEAVTIVEARRVPTFAIVHVCLARGMGLFFDNRFD